MLQLNGIFGQDTLADPRGDADSPRPIAVISSIRLDPNPGGGGTATSLTAGSSGFWGLGIFTVRILLPWTELTFSRERISLSSTPC